MKPDFNLNFKIEGVQELNDKLKAVKKAIINIEIAINEFQDSANMLNEIRFSLKNEDKTREPYFERTSNDLITK